MALIKRNGQLVEEETLQDRVAKLNLGQSPTSASGALGAGAGFHSAKMAGTKAHKQNVIRQQTDPSQSLQTQERVEQPQAAPPSTAQQAAKDKADQIQQLGSLSSRVQSQIEQRLAQSTTGLVEGQIDANKQAIASALGYTPEQVVANEGQISDISDALSNYMQDPSEQQLIDLINMGVPKERVYSLTGLLETGEQATSSAIAESMADEFSLADLDPTFVTQAEALIPGAGNMTVPQFQDAIRELQNAEFDRIEELQAQLAGLPPESGRARQIREELKGLSIAGTTGTEASVEETAEDIDFADTVDIAGREVSVEDFLSDETVSGIIEEYLRASDEEKEALLPAEQYQGLRDWIEDNQIRLASVIEGGEEIAQSLEEANAGWQTLLQDVNIPSQEILAAMGFEYDPDKIVSSEQLNNTITGIETSAIGQLAQDPENSKIVGDLDEEWATKFTNETDELGELVWNAQSIKESHALAEEAIDPTIQAFAGVSELSTFVDKNTLVNYQAVKEVAEATSKLPNASQLVSNEQFMSMAKEGKLSTDWLDSKYAFALADNNVLDLIESGELTAENRDELLSGYEGKKQKFDNLKEDVDLFNEAMAENDLEAMLDFIVADSNVNVADIEQKLEDAELAKKLGYDGADDLINKYKELLNPATYKKAVPEFDIMDVLEGGTKFDPFKKLTIDRSPDFKGNEQEMYVVSNLMSDGRIDPWEISELPASIMERLDSLDLPIKAGNVVSHYVGEQLKAGITTNRTAMDNLLEKPVAYKYDVSSLPEDYKAIKDSVSVYNDQIKNSINAIKLNGHMTDEMKKAAISSLERRQKKQIAKANDYIRRMNDSAMEHLYNSNSWRTAQSVNEHYGDTRGTDKLLADFKNNWIQKEF